MPASFAALSMDHRTPSTPEHAPALPHLVRVINVFTALTGLMTAGLIGIAAIMIGITVIFLVPAMLIIVLLYWGCGSYGAAFTRFERFDWRRILLQICFAAIMIAGSITFYSNTHPLKSDHPSWHGPASTLLLVFFSLTVGVHLFSLAALFRFRRQVKETKPG